MEEFPVVITVNLCIKYIIYSEYSTIFIKLKKITVFL